MKSRTKTSKTTGDPDVVPVPKGTITVIPERCKGCEFCVHFCPKNCLAMSEDFTAKGYHYPLVKRPKDCIGCDRCTMVCPDFAIFFTKEKKQ